MKGLGIFAPREWRGMGQEQHDGGGVAPLAFSLLVSFHLGDRHLLRVDFVAYFLSLLVFFFSRCTVLGIEPNRKYID